MDADEPFVPSRQIDTSKPSVARVYDCLLGGKDNYAVERAVVQQINRVAPEMARLARAQRAWLGRVTRFLVASARIRQIIHVGAGLPRPENTHEIAQRIDPSTRVIYVEHDPVVLAHGRAVLEENAFTHLADAELTRPDEVLGHEVVEKYLDPGEPIALIHSSTMHHVPDRLRPVEIVRRYVELVPSGSYLVLSHFCDPQDDGPATQLARVVEDVLAGGDTGSGYFRTRAEIAAFFAGLQMIDPGLGRLRDWWPDGPLVGPSTREDELLLGGVGRKP